MIPFPFISSSQSISKFYELHMQNIMYVLLYIVSILVQVSIISHPDHWNSFLSPDFHPCPTEVHSSPTQQPKWSFKQMYWVTYLFKAFQWFPIVLRIICKLFTLLMKLYVIWLLPVLLSFLSTLIPHLLCSSHSSLLSAFIMASLITP